MAKATLTPADFASIYENFNAPVSRFDCGQKCSPLNGGSPVCCSTQAAVPVVHKVEFELLKTRTDLWKKFKPYDYSTRQIVEELTHDCCAIPYLTRERQFVGVGTYWIFQDRCWMMSNLEIVDRKYVEEFIAAYEALFLKDPTEFKTYVDFSASARRVFSRWKRPLALLGRQGELLVVDPPTGAIRPGRKADFPKAQPFTSEKEYRAAIKEAGGEVPAMGLRVA